MVTPKALLTSMVVFTSSTPLSVRVAAPYPMRRLPPDARPAPIPGPRIVAPDTPPR